MLLRLLMHHSPSAEPETEHHRSPLQGGLPGAKVRQSPANCSSPAWRVGVTYRSLGYVLVHRLASSSVTVPVHEFYVSRSGPAQCCHDHIAAIPTAGIGDHCLVINGIPGVRASARFHWSQMVEELIREDGMCVMSAGMGWQKAVAVILRLHMERRRFARPRHLIT